MRGRLVAGLAVAALMAVGSPLSAQRVVRDSTCTYDRCALWVDGQKIRQGAAGEVIARAGFFRPLRLTPLMQGLDSAGVLAARHDARVRLGDRLTWGGAGVLLAGFLMWQQRVRSGERPSTDDASAGEAAVMTGGLVMEFAGVLVVGSAEPLRQRAVWWYNRQFAPERGGRSP